MQLKNIAGHILLSVLIRVLLEDSPVLSMNQGKDGIWTPEFLIPMVMDYPMDSRLTCAKNWAAMTMMSNDMCAIILIR